MPLYAYRCPQGHECELLQPVGAEAPNGCPDCGSGPLQRLLSPPSLRFHGSGFYATDYGHKHSSDS